MSLKQQQYLSQFCGFKSKKFLNELILILKEAYQNMTYETNHSRKNLISDNYNCYSLDLTTKIIEWAIETNKNKNVQKLGKGINVEQLSKIIAELIVDEKYIYFECINKNCNYSIQFKYFSVTIFYGCYSHMPRYLYNQYDPYDKIYRSKKINQTNVMSFCWKILSDSIPWMAVSSNGTVEPLKKINHHIFCEFFKLFDEYNISTSHLKELDGPVCSPRCLVHTIFGDAYGHIRPNIAKEYLLHVVQTNLQIPLIIQHIIAAYMGNW